MKLGAIFSIINYVSIIMTRPYNVITYVNFSTENHLLRLFFRVRIESHFLLKNRITVPIVYLIKLLFEQELCTFLFFLLVQEHFDVTQKQPLRAVL